MATPIGFNRWLIADIRPGYARCRGEAEAPIRESGHSAESRFAFCIKSLA
jgi:hypothetical protein